MGELNPIHNIDSVVCKTITPHILYILYKIIVAARGLEPLLQEPKSYVTSLYTRQQYIKGVLLLIFSSSTYIYY